MSDKVDGSIQDLQKLVAEFAIARGWLRFHNPRNLAAAIAIEASELLECFQWRSDDMCMLSNLDDVTLRAIQSELADVVIYVLNMANALDVHLASVVRAKLAENVTRFPVPSSQRDP